MKRLPLLLLLAIVCAGCEDKETRTWYAPPDTAVPSREPAKSAPGLIGTWELTGADGSVWYAHFLKDGAWRITDDRAGTKERVYGTYTADDSSFRGDMTNPGVGTGSISGYYNGRSLALDFVENWHSPAKHVSYTGKKL